MWSGIFLVFFVRDVAKDYELNKCVIVSHVAHDYETLI